MADVAEHALQSAVYNALRMIEETDLSRADLAHALELADALSVEITRLCDLAEPEAGADPPAHSASP